MARAKKTLRCKRIYIKPSKRNKASSSVIIYPDYQSLMSRDGDTGLIIIILIKIEYTLKPRLQSSI